MDARHFDTLARVLSARNNRRHVLGALASLPVLGGLAGGLSPEDAEGQGRRKRRKKAHKHGRGRRRNHARKKKTCKAESVAQTCSGKCGVTTNNCKQTVDCGPCACTPLTACPAGKDCGTFPDGCGGFVTCPTTCDNPTPICTDNVCGPCTGDSECASGQLCAGGQCVTGSGTCAAGANVCTAPGFESPCDGNPDCFCIPTLAGATRCAQYYTTEQGFLRPCTSDAECADLGPGAFCPRQFDSCGGVCSLPCPAQGERGAPAPRG